MYHGKRVSLACKCCSCDATRKDCHKPSGFGRGAGSSSREGECSDHLANSSFTDVFYQLRSLNASVEAPAPESSTQLLQLRALRRAYQDLTHTEPYLPDKINPIPSLLALRTTHKTLQQGGDCLDALKRDHDSLQQLLKMEEDDLSEAGMIARAMDSRIENLRSEIEERTQRSQDEIGRGMLRDVENKRKQYENEIKAMVRGFNKFIDEHLGGMLAVEEMGGPVVGEMVEVDELTLEAGFTSQGKVKKGKSSQAGEDKRQRRIDEIWGKRESDVGEDRDERKEAAAEMRNLTEDLMNATVEFEAGGDAYVVIPRESAAARYLVRAKVAQLHPKDARRIRLVDFGRDLDN